VVYKCHKDNHIGSLSRDGYCINNDETDLDNDVRDTIDETGDNSWW